MNEFKRKARDNKVRAMVAYFETELPRNHYIDPLRQPEEAADFLRKLSQLEWRQHAILAGQRPPSEESQTEIIAHFEKRVFETNVAQRRIGGLN